MTNIEDVFKGMRSSEQMDALLGNTREAADILEMEKDDAGYFRLSIMDTVDNLANEVMQYGTEVREILNGINISTNLMPELLDELQKPDREMMLEYLNLIETNTRALAGVGNEDESPATANQMSLIMNATADSLTDSMDRQTFLLEALLNNSNFERGLIERKEDSFQPTTTADTTDRPEEQPKQQGGIMGFLGGLMNGWSKLPNVVKALGKKGLAAAAVIGTGMFLKDLYDTFNNEEELRKIIGKAEGALTAAEHSTATIAGAIEKFTGGLIDAKTTYDLIYDGVDLMQKGLDQIFDPDTGLLGDFTTSLFNLIENGDWSAFGKEFIDSIINLPQKIIEKLTEWWGNLTDLSEKVLGKEFNDGVKSAADFAVNKVTDFGKWAYDGAKDLVGFGDDEPEAAQIIQKASNTEVDKGPRTVPSLSEKPVNRSMPSQSEKLSKERFEQMSKAREPAPVTTPIVQTTNNNNYSPIIREDSLGKQIQLLSL